VARVEVAAGDVGEGVGAALCGAAGVVGTGWRSGRLESGLDRLAGFGIELGVDADHSIQQCRDVEVTPAVTALFVGECARSVHLLAVVGDNPGQITGTEIHRSFDQCRLMGGEQLGIGVASPGQDRDPVQVEVAVGEGVGSGGHVLEVAGRFDLAAGLAVAQTGLPPQPRGSRDRTIEFMGLAAIELPDPEEALRIQPGLLAGQLHDLGAQPLGWRPIQVFTVQLIDRRTKGRHSSNIRLG